MPEDVEPVRLTAGSWWQCVVLGPAGNPTRVVVVESHAYPDGTRVELAAQLADRQIGANALCEAELDEDGRVTRLHPSRRFAPTMPPIWFVEVRESAATPPAVNLMAFTGTSTPPGTLIDQGDWSNLDVRSSDQLGAVRWLPATGRSDQLYVQPQWRRQHVASALLAAAECLSVARGWPRLWGDGQRTELGEVARNARTWSRRTADLTHLAPPMTEENPSD